MLWSSMAKIGAELLILSFLGYLSVELQLAKKKGQKGKGIKSHFYLQFPTHTPYVYM